MTSLREEVIDGLKRGVPLLTLVELVQRHKRHGLGQQAAYDVLENIWIEFGCQESGEEDSQFCGLLGGLIDRVWGYCSSKDAIWDTSLSGQH